MNLLKKTLFKTPATFAMATITILTGILSGIAWGGNYSQNIVKYFGYGLPSLEGGNYLTLITGVFFAAPPWIYFIVMPVFLVGGFFIERKVGSLKMLATFFVAQIISVVLVSLILMVGSAYQLSWATALSTQLDVGLSNGALALIGVITAALPLYWRFRVRIIWFMALLAMVLFSAELADLTHFVGFLFGLSFGPLIIGRPYYKFNFFKPNMANSRAFVAALILFYSITHFVAQVLPGNGGVLEFGRPSDDISFMTRSLIVAFSLLFAWGLYEGRRVAWVFSFIISLILLAIDSFYIIHTTTALSVFKFILMSLIFMSLLLLRKNFTAKASPLVLKQVITKLVIGAMAIFMLNTIIIYGLRFHFTPVPTLNQAVTKSAHKIVNGSTDNFEPNSKTTNLVLELIDDVWVIYTLVAIIMLVVVTKKDSEMGTRKLYVDLLKKWGGSTLSWMGTWGGLKYYTNKSKTAILAFKQEGNVCIVLADPVGSQKTCQTLMLDFNQQCLENGWTVSYFSCSLWVMRFLDKQGFKHVKVAEDTIIDLKGLEFSGKSGQSIRSSVNRANKLGVIMKSVSYKDAPFAIKDQLQAIEDSWVSDKALPEMGFTLGSLKQAEDKEVRLNIAQLTKMEMFTA